MITFFKKWDGREGKVVIPELGAVIGTFTQWTLTRRGERGEEALQYDLRASFSFVPNRALWDDPEYAAQRQVVLTWARGKHFRLEQAVGMRTVLDGKSLVMEGVSLHASDS